MTVKISNMIPFITSKVGKLNSIPVFEYSFSEDLNTQPEQKEKFLEYLSKKFLRPGLITSSLFLLPLFLIFPLLPCFVRSKGV